MVKKKRSIHETSTTVIVEDDSATTPVQEDPVFTNLNNTLAEIRKRDGVVGYILRSKTQATIDLKEPEKIVEYAILASQVMDSSQEISNQFDLGNIENVLIEGKKIKALCMTIGDNKISIFMEPNADHTDILKTISA